MKQNQNKQLRRFQTETKKHQRKNYSACGKGGETPAVCSCWMWGNPRKFFKQRTPQGVSFDGLHGREVIDV